MEDGVSPTGNAYRNPRPQTLLNQLGHKSSEKSIQISLTSIGNFDIKEAGDTVSHEKFQQLFDHAQNVISNSQNVFVEDAAVGTNQIDRVGVRVISTCPEFTLASRNLLVIISLNCLLQSLLLS